MGQVAGRQVVYKSVGFRKLGLQFRYPYKSRLVFLCHRFIEGKFRRRGMKICGYPLRSIQITRYSP